MAQFKVYLITLYVQERGKDRCRVSKKKLILYAKDLETNHDWLIHTKKKI